MFLIFQSKGGGLHSRPPQCLIAKSSEYSELLPDGESNPAPLHIFLSLAITLSWPYGELGMVDTREIAIFALST